MSFSPEYLGDDSQINHNKEEAFLMIEENVNVDPLTDYIRTHAPQLAAEVTEETPLLEHGLLDSLNLMTLVAFLERRYQLALPEDQITLNNFRDLASIRRLIDRLKHA